MQDVDEIVQEFLIESIEGLDQMDRDLVALERSPADVELLSRVFRCIHSIKGASGFLGYSQLGDVAHAGESLLSELRDGRLVLTPAITSGLLQLVDAIRLMLDHVRVTGKDGTEAWGPLIALFQSLQAGGDTNGNGYHPEPAAPPEEPGETPPSSVMPEPEMSESLPDPEILASVSAPAGSPPPDPVAGPPERRSDPMARSNIRVDVGLLDRLMNLVGELVLARNQVVRHTSLKADAGLTATAQRLNLITTELQEGVMKTRMQPIGNVWSKFPRVVRDLAVQCSKQARIDMEGRETELDKTIIEAITDPLTHVVRNAMDHGLEGPEERLAAGKPAEGRLLLRAYHEGGQVNIEVSDDGRGLDPERLRATAIRKGLITPEIGARLSEREVFDLVFAPGFSTAAQVTSVSGRGVGMDVVRTNIERIGGTVDVQSVLGQGTTLRMKIPLTLAIIPALTVSCSGARYAIPQVNLLELVRVDPGSQGPGIEMVHDAPVFRLRDTLLPLVDLAQALGGARRPWAAADLRDAISIVVLHADGRPFGLIVDDITDTEEIVVKPLSKLLKNATLFAGATIMGDGCVALILDVPSLAHKAAVLTAGQGARRDIEEDPTEGHPRRTATRLLIFDLGDHHRMAVPLSEIARLEEFPPDAVEWAGHERVVQYRGAIMPLLHLGDIMGHPATASATGLLQVVVYARQGRPVGIVVGKILDIIEETLPPEVMDAALPRQSIVIQGRVTDLLDLDAVIASHDVVRSAPERITPALAGLGV